MSSRRCSAEILLLLHNKHGAAILGRHKHSDLAACDGPFRRGRVCVCGACEQAMLNVITDGNGVCVCGYVGRQHGRSAGRDNCSVICPLLLTHTLPLRPLKA